MTTRREFHSKVLSGLLGADIAPLAARSTDPKNLRRALSMTNGDAGTLVASPISIGLRVAAAVL